MEINLCFRRLLKLVCDLSSLKTFLRFAVLWSGSFKCMDLFSSICLFAVRWKSYLHFSLLDFTRLTRNSSLLFQLTIAIS